MSAEIAKFSEIISIPIIPAGWCHHEPYHLGQVASPPECALRDRLPAPVAARDDEPLGQCFASALTCC